MNWLYGTVLVVHVLVSLFMIVVILLQGGRGGMAEAFGGAAAQSLFGSGVTTVLTRVTTISAGLFVATCLSLAYLSTLRGRSVIEQIPMSLPGVLPTLPSTAPDESSVPPPSAAPVAPDAAQPAATTAPAPDAAPAPASPSTPAQQPAASAPSGSSQAPVSSPTSP